MKKNIFFILLFVTMSFGVLSQTINPDDWPNMVGYWTFDNSSDIEEANVGNNLELFGTQLAVPGPIEGDGATRIGLDSYYKCTHNIDANGGGTAVNEYSLLIDFKLPEIGQYYCFYQTNIDNANDGEIFINPSGHVGISETYYSYCILDPGEWYRLVISVDLGNHFRYYIDGNLVLEGTSQNIDGRFSLDPFFYWFRDDNNEDNEFDVAAAAIFDNPLNASEISTLGGYGHIFPDIPIAGTDPYLQSPTPNSIYISWHADETTETYVEYGTSTALGEQVNATYQDISGKTWHTAKLEGLTPNTAYFYKCTSGEDSSDISSFKTLHVPEAPNEHVRFLLLGDSRTDVYRTSIISQTAEQQLIATYGENWKNDINFVMHVGDVAQSDAIQNYTNEFFTPYANLSKQVPFMISVGNHEYNGGAINYYDYMKYEELTGAPYDFPSEFNEKFYKFKIGNCLFISFNSNWQMSNIEQLNWLEDTLNEAEEDPTIDFVFPFAHHPGRSEIWPDGNTAYVQNDIFSLMKNYSKIAMYSYGHSHGYERGVLELDDSNVNYTHDMHLLLTGGAGSALDRWGMYDNQQDYPEIHMTLDHYVYSIVDVDIDNQSWQVKTYSLGHSDLPLDNVLIDEWHYYMNDPKPDTPIAIAIENQGTYSEKLVASTFSGVDALMSSQFQITETPGDYTAPIFDVTRDWHNLYGDSGAPNYTPTDLNTGIDLQSCAVEGVLSNIASYSWRVRYRDFNLKWSDWSEESTIYPVSNTAIATPEFLVNISPNPTTTTIGVRYKLKKEQYVSIRLYDATNRLMRVYFQKEKQQQGTHTYNLDCSNLEQGIYFCVFDFSGKKVSKPIIIK